MSTHVVSSANHSLVERQSLLDTIYALTLALSGAANPAETVRRILEKLVQLSALQAAECRLSRDGEREALNVQVGLRTGDSALRARALERLYALGGYSRKPMVVGDLAESNDPILQQLGSENGLASLIYFPFWNSDVVPAGSLVLYSATARVYGQHELLLLQTFARQIASALQASRNHHDEQARIRTLRLAKSLGAILGRVSVKLQAAHTEDELFALLPSALRKMGLLSALLMGDAAGGLRLRATSVSPSAMGAIQNLSGIDLYRATLQSHKVPWLRRVQANQTPILMHNVQRFLQPLLRSGHQRLLGKWLWVAGLTPQTAVALLPIAIETRPVGVLCIWGRGLSADMLPELAIFGSHVSQVLASVRLLEQVEAAQERQCDVTRQLINVQEEERARISRQLHDEAGQSLAALKIQLFLLQKLVPPDQPHLSIGLQRSADEVGHLVQQMRLMSHEVHPPALSDLGLNAALEECCLAFAQNNDLQIHYHGMPVPNVSREIGITLYRFLQEALTNVARHSGGKSVHVLLKSGSGGLTVSVHDDGMGFDPQKLRAGLGLRSIRERLELINGAFEIESTADRGTLLTARVPVNAEG